MGAISSAQRDSKPDTSTSESSARAEGAGGDSAEEKLLQKNGQISSLSEKTECQADESNGPYEQRVLADVGSGFVTLKDDGTETTEDLQEGDTSQGTEELVKETINADGVTVKKEDEVEKQNDIEVGFKRIFRFVGFKFTLKKDKCDKTDTEEPTAKEQDSQAGVCSEDSRDTTESSAVGTSEQDSDLMQKDTACDVQAESEPVNTAPETENETSDRECQTTEIPENQEKNPPDEGQAEEAAQIPKPEEPMSQFKRFFTQGIFASFRRKRKEEEAPKEKKKEELKKTDEEEGEKLAEAPQEGITCVCLDMSNITPEEGKDLQPGEKDPSKPAEGDLIISQEQDKVPASPLKRLFRKLSTRRQREAKPAETSVTESCENLNENLQASTEFIKATKEEEAAKVEEPKPAEEDQITDTSPEESKKKSDSTVSWESLICIGSAKKRARKTSDSEDAVEDKAEEAKNPAESPLGSSTEGGYDQLTSSNEQAGSPAEEESGSTWKSLKKLVTPKRKSRADETGSSEQIPSDTEMTKEETSCSIKKLIPGRKKRKFDGQQEQSPDEAGRGSGTDNEEDETPVIVPLSEYEIVEPESVKETTEATEAAELEKEVQTMVEEDKPKDTTPLVKPSYDVGPLVVPIPPDYIEDLTEFISKHQQLSDIPEEGVIEESVVTPVSSAEWTTQDDTLAEDIVELTADAVTAPEPASEQFSGDETTEMVSAVSQLTESPKTSGNVTPVPPEYDLREADVIIQEVVESIFMTPSVMLISSKDKDPEALAVSVSPCCVEIPTSSELKLLVAHEKEEALNICTGLISQEIGEVEEALPLALVEGISEFSEAVSTELVSEDLTEGPELAGLATDDVHAAEVKEMKTEVHEAILPEKASPALDETEKQKEEMHVDMEESRKGDVSMEVQKEEVKECTTEAINDNQAEISAVQGEILPLEEQVMAQDTNEIIEIEGTQVRALCVKEPVHEEPALYTEITVEGEKEHKLPDVKLSTTDVEQVALSEVFESVAHNVTIAEPDSTIDEASEITEDVVEVSLAEVGETVTQHVVVSEPNTTLDKASETTEGMVGVFVSSVECPETPDTISIVGPVSDSIKELAVELEDEIQMENIPSLHFVDNHEIRVEVKDTEMEMAKANVEATLDVATALKVADIYEKVEDIEEVPAQQQIECVTAEESAEMFPEEIVYDVKVENLLEIVSEPPLEENELNSAVHETPLTSVTTEPTNATEESKNAPEVKLDLEKEQPDYQETKQSTEDEAPTVTPDEAAKPVELIQAPVISEQTSLQEESVKEGSQQVTTDITEEIKPERQKAELSLETHETEAAPETVEAASAVTETQQTSVDAAAVISAKPSEDEPQHQEETTKPEMDQETAKEPQEIVEAAAPSSQSSPEVNTGQQQIENAASKSEENQATEPSPQTCTEDKQVAEVVLKVTKTISDLAIIHAEETSSIGDLSTDPSNATEPTSEVEKSTTAKPEAEEPVTTVHHLEATPVEDQVEAVKVEATLTVNQEPEALVTIVTEVGESAGVKTEDIQEPSEAVREQKADTACVTVQEVVTSPQVEKAAAAFTETLSVMEQKDEPATTMPEAETAVSADLVTEPPLLTENETETPEATPPKVQTQVMNELQAEALEVTVPKVETHVVTEVKLETAVVTELEVEKPVVTSVVAELEVETPVVTSVAKNIDPKTTDLPSTIIATEAEPVLSVKLPAAAQGTDVGGIPTQGEEATVAEILVPQLQTAASPEKQTVVEVSKEKDTQVKTAVAAELTKPTLEMPKAKETVVQTAASPEKETLVEVSKEKDTQVKTAVAAEVTKPTLVMPKEEEAIVQTAVSLVKETLVEVSKEKDTQVKTPVAAEVTKPTLEVPKTEETVIQTAVPEVEAQTPALTSALKIETLVGTCEEVNLDTQGPAVTIVKEVKEVGSIFSPSIINEPKTPVIPAEQTSVVAPVTQTPDAVQEPKVLIVTQDKVETKAETTALDVKTPITVTPEVSEIKAETAAASAVNIKPPAATSAAITEPEVKEAPVKEAQAEPAVAPVIYPPTVTPEVQTLTKAQTPAIVPPAEKPPTAAPVVQAPTSDTTVKEATPPVKAPEVKETYKEASAEVEPPSLTEPEATVATEQVTPSTQSTAESKEEPVGVPKDISLEKTPEPLADMEEDVWEDAVDDIRVDECSTPKAGV